MEQKKEEKPFDFSSVVAGVGIFQNSDPPSEVHAKPFLFRFSVHFVTISAQFQDLISLYLQKFTL